VICTSEVDPLRGEARRAQTPLNGLVPRSLLSRALVDGLGHGHFGIGAASPGAQPRASFQSMLTTSTPADVEEAKAETPAGLHLGLKLTGGRGGFLPQP